jgi:hypothetical protein
MKGMEEDAAVSAGQAYDSGFSGLLRFFFRAYKKFNANHQIVWDVETIPDLRVHANNARLN